VLKISSSAASQTRAVIACLNLLLKTRPRGIHIAGPKREIASSLAFRIAETALRGVTRFPEVLEQRDIELLTQLVPLGTPQARNTGKKLLAAIIREEINSGRMVAVEVTSPQQAAQRHITEYWVMTPEQWRDLQRMPTALPPGTTYQRALTSK
jgi:hypothetical protein